ncbi:MAG TPA: VanW family protein [Euzebyales bacterium]|nr:VanW family protein [Euzebyales bacterium]
MQTVTSSTESEQTPTSRRPSRRTIALGAAGVVVVLAVALIALRATRSGVLPGLVLEGEAVGGMTRTELEQTVTRLRDDRAADMISAEGDGHRRRATAATIGHALDAEATVDGVWRRGRQLNPIAALSDHIRGSFGAVTAAPVTTIDEGKLTAWVDGVVHGLEQPPTEGDVRFEGSEVRREDPAPGSRPSADSVRAATTAALARPGPATIEYETEEVAPRTTTADVDRLVERARTIISAPVELTRRDEALRLDAETLAGLYTVEQRGSGDGLTLELAISRSALAEVFTEEVRERFEVEPRDATVVLTDGGPQVRDGRSGFRIDRAAAARQIDELARTPSEGGAARSAELEGETVEPERTTEEAKDLQITQEVSSFTTEHACCQGRVTNIQRFADLMDGALIEPDEVFSLNGHVGRRTAGKGFVAGGAIQQGEYVDEVGGGVSQFATTFFNAAYFGGYEIVEHKPHSYYISRYPVGRESTINYPNVDVKIRNDSPYGILVDTSYTDTSITVTFWGRKWVEVESSTGEPHNHTSPQTETRENPDLAPGSEQVIQAGGNGFDVVVTRRLRYEDGRTETEEFFTRYLAEPRIIERGPAGGDDGGGGEGGGGAAATDE